MDDLDISLVIQQWNQLVHSMENSMEDYPLGLLRFASRSILNAPSSRDGCPVKNAGLTMKNAGVLQVYQWDIPWGYQWELYHFFFARSLDVWNISPMKTGW